MRGLVLIGATVLALAAPALANAYGWPVKPFDREHAVRGGFDDPRFHVDADSRIASFHFGVDISVPDGTKVYAVAPGTAVRFADSVSVRRAGGREFSYWHVRGVVRTGQRIRLHQLLGTTTKGWGHVHLAESISGIYLNPLRPSALTPYRDTTTPVVAAVQVTDVQASPIDSTSAIGSIWLVADAYDLPPTAPEPPWQVARLAPQLLRWRLLRGDAEVLSWRTAADLRYTLLPNVLYDSIYAPGTYQNKANRPGRYRFWLGPPLDTAALGPGTYVVEVEARDFAGHTGTGSTTFTVPS